MTQLQINEVATRDGFQIETTFVPTEEKIHLIDALSASRLARIEATSFVSPRAIPALVGHETPGRVVKTGKADRRYPLPAR